MSFGERNRPQVGDLRCLKACSGLRAASAGSRARLEGRHLAHVVEVRFRSRSGSLAASPLSVSRGRLTVLVPDGATSGRPRVVGADGAIARSPRRLRVVPRRELPPRGTFHLLRSRVSPRRAFFDGRRVRLRYRFRAYGPTEVEVRLVRHGSDRAVRSRPERRVLPYSSVLHRWSGIAEDGEAAANGRYRFELGRAGSELERAGRLRFYGHRFPVRGPHSYGDPFGAPRSGERTHEGQDVVAGCGTKLAAARGGRVQARGYSERLYGHWVLIDGRKTSRDYFYSHLRGPGPLGRGERVRTGQRIGAVGKSGNARFEFCQLHFELWPRGFRRGTPADPAPALRRWDGWS